MKNLSNTQKLEIKWALQEKINSLKETYILNQKYGCKDKSLKIIADLITEYEIVLQIVRESLGV